MTRKADWADKKGEALAYTHAEYVLRENAAKDIARALRAAYRRGAKEEREACLRLTEWTLLVAQQDEACRVRAVIARGIRARNGGKR